MFTAEAAPALPAPRGPVARVSGAAIRANAAALARGTAVGLPADAFGHGFDAVAGILREAGLVPTPDGAAHAEAVLGLLPGAVPAMRLTGMVLSTKALRAGDGVSYGYAHRAASDTTAALVVGGYAQGIVRALGGNASVLVAGDRRPIVGRVAMDVCVVDVGDADVARGDDVVFFGDPAAGEPSVRDWATVTGMTPLELVTAAGLRAVREHT